jgi:protein phosphatase
MRALGWATTDVGRKREHNEDAFLCDNELGLFAVADGMGGHLGGERASHMAVDVLASQVAEAVAGGLKGRAAEARRESEPHPVAAALKGIVSRAARAIHEASHQEARYAGMGTTLTGMLFHQRHVTICHVGDSRAYLYRDGRARQLTEDHSWIQEQVRAGVISQEDALLSRFRNIITRSVGFEPNVEADVATLPVEAGDCFLLCSDGLSNHVSPEEIAQTLTGHFYVEAGARLAEIANERGGDDNITCVIVYVGNSLAVGTV